MNEIEKIMQNAGANQICDTFANWMQCEWKTRQCEDCEHFVYPPFTAEKQLELIKWLGIRDEFNFYQNKATKDWVFYDHEKEATHYNFELGLASWVNYLWQDLTDEERKQIKEILE